MSEKEVDVMALARSVETLQNDRDVDKLVWQKIQTTLDEQTKAIQAITIAIGSTSTDEHGQPVGTGIKGDVMRIRLKVDQKFSVYDGWAKYATGAIMAASVAIAVVWWLVQERVEFLK